MSISNDYPWIKVHWGVTFKKTGDRPVGSDVSYFVYRGVPEPKSIMFIAQQDEQKAMQEFGLISS
jgi:hypothetical protein